ncbi:hypothetical protein WN55_08181 [Dufourea novaeangliae]|uniref:Uncharacterized protein n=1 Tax=Dufourea novaeangliae TaxID=178035 RepID=A0A154P6H4_DUFNO|nr:hypothetical protein WN55_08181 [Dufourea novaeangliae]
MINSPEALSPSQEPRPLPRTASNAPNQGVGRSEQTREKKAAAREYRLEIPDVRHVFDLRQLTGSRTPPLETKNRADRERQTSRAEAANGRAAVPTGRADFVRLPRKSPTKLAPVDERNRAGKSPSVPLLDSTGFFLDAHPVPTPPPPLVPLRYRRGPHERKFEFSSESQTVEGIPSSPLFPMSKHALSSRVYTNSSRDRKVEKNAACVLRCHPASLPLSRVQSSKHDRNIDRKGNGDTVERHSEGKRQGDDLGTRPRNSSLCAIFHVEPREGGPKLRPNRPNYLNVERYGAAPDGKLNSRLIEIGLQTGRRSAEQR